MADSAPAEGEATTIGKRRMSVTEQRVRVSISHMAHDDIAKVERITGGRVPSKWLSRTSQILAAEEYRNSTVLLQEVQQNTMDPKVIIKAARLARATERGWISGRTAADAMVTSGVNPFASDQIGMDILMGFRRKAMVFIIIQSLFINGIALGLDRYCRDYFPDLPWYYYLASWLVPMVALLILGCVRYKSPLNFILLAVFTITLGVAMGLLGPPMERFTGADVKLYSPQCYGLFGHTVSLIILLLATCTVPCGKKVVKMAPVGVVVDIVTDIIGVIAYLAFFAYIGPPVYLAIMIFMHTCSVLWISYQMDKLGARLQVDEWLQPVVLLWCEVFVVLVVVFVLAIALAGMVGPGEGDAVSFGGGDACCGGCYGVYCDCYINYDDEEIKDEQDPEAPAQQDI